MQLHTHDSMTRFDMMMISWHCQDGKRVVSGSVDKTVRIWDADTGREVQKLEGHYDRVNSVAFSPVGETNWSLSGE